MGSAALTCHLEPKAEKEDGTLRRPPAPSRLGIQTPGRAGARWCEKACDSLCFRAQTGLKGVFSSNRSKACGLQTRRGSRASTQPSPNTRRKESQQSFPVQAVGSRWEGGVGCGYVSGWTSCLTAGKSHSVTQALVRINWVDRPGRALENMSTFFLRSVAGSKHKLQLFWSTLGKPQLPSQFGYI